MLTKKGYTIVSTVILGLILLIAFAAALTPPKKVTYDGHMIYVDGKPYMQLEEDSCE